MRADDLDHKELLELDPEGGVIRFAGQRALLLDAVAMGLLRKYLVENFGLTAARTVLTQFGFAHGWRMAEAMQAEFKWDSDDEWRRAGTRIHALEGLFRVEAGGKEPLSKAGADAGRLATRRSSTCCTSAAPTCPCAGRSAASPAATSAAAPGKEIYVLEDRCMGKGDAACHLFGRTREEWGDERAEELRFFEPTRLKECLDVSLHRVTETLKAAERKLREHRRALVRVARDVDEPLGHRRQEPGDAAARGPGAPRGQGRLHRAHHRRERLGQGADRAAGPRRVDARGGPVHRGQLRRHHRDAARERAVRTRARRVHRRDRRIGPGLFEAANGGTLLLDEVGEVSPGMQVKLLRALQEREIRRVGENKSRRVDVRVVAATNRDLAHGVAGGAFRQDLYYRLKVVELHVPPLRERRDDILPLARVLLADAALRMKRKISGLAPGAADQLLRYEWPGNVRELENAMERAVALARGSRVELEDLPEEIRQAFPTPVATEGTVRPLDEIEKEYILAALELNGGNQTHTAEQLQIGSATLYRKLKSYGLIGGERARRKSR